MKLWDSHLSCRSNPSLQSCKPIQKLLTRASGSASICRGNARILPSIPAAMGCQCFHFVAAEVARLKFPGKSETDEPSTVMSAASFKIGQERADVGMCLAWWNSSRLRRVAPRSYFFCDGERSRPGCSSRRRADWFVRANAGRKRGDSGRTGAGRDARHSTRDACAPRR